MALETLLPFASLVSVLVLGALGFIFTKRSETTEQRTSIGGAAIVDSSAIHALIDAILQLKGSHDRKVDVLVSTLKAMERQAVALEQMLSLQVERDRHASKERLNSEIDDLKQQIAELKRQPRQN